MNILYCGNYEEISSWLRYKLDLLNIYGHGPEFIVKIMYRYKDEPAYREENQVVWFDEHDNMVWLNDWWEGQEDILVLGYMPVEDIELEVMIHGSEQHNG